MGQAIIIDRKAKEIIALYDDKLAIKMTFEEAQKNQALMFGESLAKISNETKIIEGYKCKKVNINYSVWNKPNRIIEIWFTSALAASNDQFTFKGIDGFIMSYSYIDILYPDEDGIDLKEIMTCSKVEKMLISDDRFKIPEDYKVSTMEELRKNMQIEYH